jgi:hypothetical protein
LAAGAPGAAVKICEYVSTSHSADRKD